MPFLKHWAPDAGLGEIYSADPRIYGALPAFTEALFRHRSSLPIPLREFIAAYVSSLNQCEFCVAGHFANASRAGLTQELLQQLLADFETAPVRPRIKPLLKFAHKLTLQPARITQQDVDAIFAAGWDEKAFRDTVAITAQMNLFNRLVAGFGIQPGKHELPYDGIAGARQRAFRERMNRRSGVNSTGATDAAGTSDDPQRRKPGRR